jgi:ribonuclease R
MLPYITKKLKHFMTRKNKKSKQKSTPPADKKESKLFNNLAKITEQFIAGKGFKPLTEDELMQRLALPPQHIPVFQKVLRYLTEQGLLENFQGKYAWKKSRRATLKGIARMHPRGFGFVQLTEASEYTQDIFIPKHLTKNAVHGDEVEVEVSENVSEKGPEGKIVAILSRARTHMAGVINFIDRKGEMVAHVPLLGAQQRVVVQSTDEDCHGSARLGIQRNRNNRPFFPLSGTYF